MTTIPVSQEDLIAQAQNNNRLPSKEALEIARQVFAEEGEAGFEKVVSLVRLAGNKNLTDEVIRANARKLFDQWSK